MLILYPATLLNHLISYPFLSLLLMGFSTANKVNSYVSNCSTLFELMLKKK